MKFTKLIALALVLLMSVAVFAACGGPGETTPEADDTSTEPVSSDVPESTEVHKHLNKKTGNDKEATCTEEGYTEYQCSKCDEYEYRPIAMLPHAYGLFKSIDGKYTKKVCSMCQNAVVVDEAGEKVEDASGIIFPLFAGSFDGVEELVDVSALFDGFSVTPKMANIVKNDPNGEIYLNIPSGSVADAPNGCLDLNDETAQLVGQSFSLDFLARYEEAPLEKIAFLSWTVDGNTQVLLSADGKNYIDAEGNNIARISTKGWDSFRVEFTASGDYTIYLNDAQIDTGKVVTTGTTSVIRFFDDKSQFEAYLDEIIVAK